MSAIVTVCACVNASAEANVPVVTLAVASETSSLPKIPLPPIGLPAPMTNVVGPLTLASVVPS